MVVQPSQGNRIRPRNIRNDSIFHARPILMVVGGYEYNKESESMLEHAIVVGRLDPGEFYLIFQCVFRCMKIMSGSS